MGATVGEIVSLTHRWGTQVRQKCANCTKFFTGATCKHCGTQYEQQGENHRVVSVP